MAMRMAHLALYWVSSLEDPEVHVAVGKLLPTAITGPLLLVAASFTDGVPQAALWVVALLLDYGGPFVRGVAGYRVHPAHFAERFQLIVIIALGESIVAIGVGAGDEARRPRSASPRSWRRDLGGAVVGLLRRRGDARRTTGWPS